MWRCQTLASLFKCDRTSAENVLNPGRPQSAIDNTTIQKVEANIWDDRRITLHQPWQTSPWGQYQTWILILTSIGSAEKIIHGHLHMENTCNVFSMDSVVAHTLSEDENESCASKVFWPCARTIRRTFLIYKKYYLLPRAKHDLCVKMIRRQKISRSYGSLLTSHLRRKHIFDSLRAKSWCQYLGISTE